MKKLALTLALLAPLAACSKDKTDSAATAGSASATAASAAATASAASSPSLVDKALSFVTGGPFEGTVTMNVTDAGKPAKTIVYEIKGKKMRFDVPAHAGGPEGDSYIIWDADSKKATTVTDSKKMAFEMDMNSPAASAAAAAVAANKPNAEKTGKTDTVAGYSCEVWKITASNGDKTDACLASGISMPSRGAPAWVEQLGGSYFPLRVVTDDASGKEKTKMEVTKIEKKTLDDSRFQVPAGYKSMNMGDMMKSLGGLRGVRGMPH